MVPSQDISLKRHCNQKIIAGIADKTKPLKYNFPKYILSNQARSVSVDLWIPFLTPSLHRSISTSNEKRTF